MDSFKFIFFMAAKWHDSENDLLSVQMYMLVLNVGCKIQNFCGNFISLSKEFLEEFERYLYQVFREIFGKIFNHFVQVLEVEKTYSQMQVDTRGVD